MRFNPEIDELIARLKILIIAMGEVDLALRNRSSGDDNRFLAARGLFLKASDLGCTALSFIDNSPSCSNLPVNYNSISGINVIARAIYEAFLIFNYVFADQQTEDEEDEKDLRYWIWKVKGLEEWKDYLKKVNGSTDEIDKDISFAMASINGNQIFRALNKEEQDKRLHFIKWKPSIRKLGKLAGVPPIQREQHYGYLCGIAHSSYMSVIKIKDWQYNDENLGHLKVAMMLMIYSLAKFSMKYLSFWDLDPSFLPKEYKAVLVNALKYS